MSLTAWLILFTIGGIALAVAIYTIESGKKKTTSDTGSSWAKGFSDLMSGISGSDTKKTGMLIGLIAVGILIADFIVWGLIPPLWDALSHDWRVLTAINFALLAIFSSMLFRKADGKQNPIAKGIGWSLGILLLAGAGYNLMSNQYNWSDKPNGLAFYKDGPATDDRKLAAIEACESGDRKNPGSGKQFIDTPQGQKPYYHKNQDGTEDKRIVGRYQINTEAHADILDKMNLDVVNSDEDNRKFAEFLLEQPDGLRNWKSSEDCWAPLVAEGKVPISEVYKVVEVKAGKWSEEVLVPVIPNDTHIITWSSPDGCYLATDGNTNSPLKIKINLKVAPNYYQFKCDKKEKITVEVVPKSLLKKPAPI